MGPHVLFHFTHYYDVPGGCCVARSASVAQPEEIHLLRLSLGKSGWELVLGPPSTLAADAVQRGIHMTLVPMDTHSVCALPALEERDCASHCFSHLMI